MKYNVSAFACCPSHCFWISPSFMTNGDAKFQAVYFKKLPLLARHIVYILCWVQLIFSLITKRFAGSVKHISNDLFASRCDAFHSHNGCNFQCSGPALHLVVNPVVCSLIKVRHLKVESPQSWQVCFRETDQLRTLACGVHHQLMNTAQTVFNGFSNGRRSKGNFHGVQEVLMALG